MNKIWNEWMNNDVDSRFHTRTMHVLMYADDLALVAETADDLQRMLVALHEYARRWHLLVNTIKTKKVIFNGCHTGEENTKIAAQTQLYI